MAFMEIERGFSGDDYSVVTSVYSTQKKKSTIRTSMLRVSLGSKLMEEAGLEPGARVQLLWGYGKDEGKFVIQKAAGRNGYKLTGKKATSFAVSCDSKLGIHFPDTDQLQCEKSIVESDGKITCALNEDFPAAEYNRLGLRYRTKAMESDKLNS